MSDAKKPTRGSAETYERITDKAEEEELERRQAEALREWRQNGEARRDLGLEFGKTEHKDWQNELRRMEAARGRKEGRDFAIEYTLKHPDGGNIRFDFVDFRNHHIIDRKPAEEGVREISIAKKYVEQQRRYIEAYRAKFGTEPTFEFSLYSSTKNLARPK